MSVRYLSTLRFDEEWLDRLRAAVPDVDVRQVPADSVADVPAEIWQDVEVLHTSGVFPPLSLVPRLRWVQLDTSGVDHVMGEEVWDSAVTLTTIGGVSPVPLAEYVMWAVLGFAHRLPEMLEVRASRRWPTPAERWRRFLPASLPGSTTVVIGYGRIGHEIGRLARAHGMTVVGVTRSGSGQRVKDPTLASFAPDAPDDDVEVVGPDRLHEVLAAADFVVVVVPLTAQTRGLLDRAAIEAIKPGALLVDASRGGVVDHAALRDALRSGQLAGAVLDVFPTEPLPADSPWWSEPNVVVTPHVAGLAPRYEEQVLSLVAENLRRFVGGEPLLNVVDRERGY